VLRGLFGTKKSILPPPPKNQIEVACPACGAAQYEPRLVVSTFCRSCGIHLTIHKRKVTASSVTRSGAGMNDLWETQPPVEPSPSTLSVSPAAVADPQPALASPATSSTAVDSPPPEVSQAPSDVDTTAAAQTGFGAFLQAVSKSPQSAAVNPAEQAAVPPVSTHPAAPVIANPQLRKLSAPLTARSGPALPSSATIKKGPSTPVAPPNSTLEKMRSQSSFRQQHFKSIECFECGHKLKVSRASKSAPCTECGATICCEDLDINQPITTAIRTRGDVTIRKVGSVIAPLLQCRDLICAGQIEAEIRCDNDAKFRTEGTISGSVTCRKLIIEKGADVHFTDTVYAEEMFINSRTTGNLHAAGKVIIGPYGSLNGDVTAQAVSMEPGGELNGGMTILRSKPRPTTPNPSSDESAPATDPASTED
jgi:cytoskeletal protein CcmA (bactofilin family)/ribosomal protein S27E